MRVVYGSVKDSCDSSWCSMVMIRALTCTKFEFERIACSTSCGRKMTHDADRKNVPLSAHIVPTMKRTSSKTSCELPSPKTLPAPSFANQRSNLSALASSMASLSDTLDVQQRIDRGTFETQGDIDNYGSVSYSFF
jgi:hypothetical protein